MSLRLILDDPANVVSWVLKHLPEIAERGFGPSQAIGVVDKNNTPLMGIVFHDHQPQWGTIQLSMAAESPRWAHRSVIARILAYPFVTLGVFKVWAAHQHTNERAERLALGLGFKREAMLRHHFGRDRHAFIQRMFSGEFTAKYGSLLDGQKHPETARAA